MIAIHSDSKKSLVENARRAINNASSNSTSVEWNDTKQKVIVNQESSLEEVMKEMKLKIVTARIEELQSIGK